MPGITHRGLAIPSYRIETASIREQWGGGASGVETKAVQAMDDDATTLAVRAGRTAIDEGGPVDAVFVATTTPAYAYGSVTPFIVESLGLPAETYTQTFEASSRSGTAALRAAADAVGGEYDAALVLAAEAPSPAPNTDREMVAGAGAAAVRLEAGDGGLEQVATGTCTRALLDEWQAPDQARERLADDRFARDVGFVETTTRAVEDAIEAAGWTADAVDAFVVSHPNGKFASRVAGSLNLGDALATPEFGRQFGDLRTASAPGSLALADIAADDRVVVAGYGGGIADATAYRASDPPAAATAPSGSTDVEYVTYLKHINQLE